ncbi:cadherin-related tumor suppressor [Brachionus plicatilis]|uniref:Cadherin-related tumor suppressor n=1 Tax=Brachionus plicatilis TaxID=10195 RepID=A0A3M7PZN6_BRAPC|nr:cadherin-related tumor suppressor [Brachionus plicatilis]
MLRNIFLVSLVLLLANVGAQKSNKTNSRNFHAVDSAQLLNPDEQCKILLGKEASFCRSFANVVCESLYCRKSVKEPCIKLSDGVNDGTTCASGKVCLQKSCIKNAKGLVGECLFGDDLVTQESIGMNLPSPQMQCKQVLDHIEKIGQATTAYCKNSNFRTICCETCKKYEMVSCADRYFDCPRYKDACASAKVNGLSVKILCPRTCGKCKAAPIQCPQENICQNGGKCLNIKTSNESVFGFLCDCPRGYHGDLCQLRDSCMPNPCALDEKCISLGNIAYKCVLLNGAAKKPTSYNSSTSKANEIDVSKKLLKKFKIENKLLNLCDNFDDDICNYYAQQGLCGDEYYLNGKPITKKCRKACKEC